MQGVNQVYQVFLIVYQVKVKIKMKMKMKMKKTQHELYQDGGIEGMKGLFDEIEINDERSQMYLENNLNEIKNEFSDIRNKYPRFSQHIADKEKESINYEILPNKVDGINFYDKYHTLYNYLSEFNLEKTSIKDKLFLEDLSNGFKIKSKYTTSGKNNIENAYDDLVFNNKRIGDAFYKNVNKEISDKNKNIFQEAKYLFYLRVEIYKKLVVKEENLKFEKSIGETVKLKNQKDNLSEIPEDEKFITFLEQIKEEQKNIDINWFKNVFNYKTPDKMLEYLYNLKNINNYNQETSLIEESYTNFKDEVEIMSKSDKKNEGRKILDIVDNILDFILKERKTESGLKILTPN